MTSDSIEGLGDKQGRNVRDGDLFWLLAQWPGDIDIRRQNGSWCVELYEPSMQWGPYRDDDLTEAVRSAMLCQSSVVLP